MFLVEEEQVNGAGRHYDHEWRENPVLPPSVLYDFRVAFLPLRYGHYLLLGGLFPAFLNKILKDFLRPLTLEFDGILSLE